MRFLYTNADQLPNKMEDLKAFIAGREPDIIVITEVIPKAQEHGIPRVRLKLHGYTEFFSFDPETEKLGNRGKRGIAIYIKEWLRPREVSAFTDFQEQLWILIHQDDTNENSILVGGIYRSPSLDDESSVCNLGFLLDKVMKQRSKKTKVVICGDFNIKGIDWNQESCTPGAPHIAKVFLDKVQDLHLHQHITQPTRFRHGQIEQILDLVLTDIENTVENFEFFDSLGLSDHIIITFDLSQDFWDMRKQQAPKPDFKRADFDSIRRELGKAQLATQVKSKTLQEAWDIFELTLKRLTERFVPKKRPPRRKRNLYMTEEALKLRKKKERLWKRYVKSGQDLAHVEFSKVRNKLRNLTRSLKRTFENDIASNAKTNPKAFWAYVGSKVKVSPGIGTLETGSGRLAETDQAKADALNLQFASVFTHEDLTNVPYLDKACQSKVLDDINFTSEEVLKHMQALDSDKSPGPDSLHPALLRELSGEICQFLTLFFRKSLDEGKLPVVWKHANVTPIYKKGNRHELENYRPISLTPVLSKVMERIIRDAVREHLLENNLISASQHGFMPGRSTSTQLLECLKIGVKHWNKVVHLMSCISISEKLSMWSLTKGFWGNYMHMVYRVRS